MERRTFRDRETGREVWQVTEGRFECLVPYMDKPAWSADERYLVFACNRSGAWQPYRLDIDTGEAVQLVETGSGAQEFSVDAGSGTVYVPDGRRLVAVNLQSLESRVVVDFAAARSDPTPEALPVISGDGSRALGRAMTETGQTILFVAATDGANDIERVAVKGFPCLPGHEQFCPGDNNIVSLNAMSPKGDYPNKIKYDWTSPNPDARTKTWRVDLDTGEATRLILLPPMQSATHCVWNRAGTRLHFHRKTRPTWVPTALCSVDRCGGDFRVHYETSEYLLGHSCPSPDGKWIVTDSQEPDKNILMLVSLTRDEQHLLCWPNNSVGSGRPDRRLPNLPRGGGHTHPGFSPSGRYVHFQSDVSGRSHVYIVPVGDLVLR